MKATGLTRTAALLAALAFGGVALSGESSPHQAVVGQALTGISAPGVTGIIWTRRQDHYTLQILLARPPGVFGGTLPAAAPSGNPYPDVRVQLQDGTGAGIPHLRRLAVAPSLQTQAVARGGADRTGRIEVIYTFHLGDGGRAKLLTLQINERSFVAAVPPLGAPD